MAIDTQVLSALKTDFEETTEEPWEGFFCPILYERGTGSGLMDGHILPERVKTAVRTTVIQRADVDNKFGYLVEPPLIDFVNTLKFTKEEFLNKARDVTVTTIDGIKADTFVASPKASPVFPKVGLIDDGNVIGSRHVKIAPEKLRKAGQLLVEGRMAMSAPACTGAMLKSSHLTLFKFLGYRYVFEGYGQFVGRRLGEFLRDAAPKANSATYFDSFGGCWNFISGDNFPFETLRDRYVLVHFDRRTMPFGISCAFKMNGKTFIVTTPFFEDSDFEAALDSYDQFLKNRATPHSMRAARIPGFGRMEIFAEPFHMGYTEAPPERYT